MSKAILKEYIYSALGVRHEKLGIKRRKEKLKQAKEQAYDREVAKLGKDYAEKSYHKDEEIEK